MSALVVSMEAADEISKNGFAVIPGVITNLECQRLIATLGPVTGAGRRGLLTHPDVAQLAKSLALIPLVRQHLPAPARPVQAIYFDKTPAANWLVAWHQDLTIAVRSRIEVPGFGPWSVKDGADHVQPPVEILEKMLTVRLHLDDCDERNGALWVAPGTHLFGRLSPERVTDLTNGQDGYVCRACAGDALLMRPLLLHRSRRSLSQIHRRVLHIDYASAELPGGLQWFELLAA